MVYVAALGGGGVKWYTGPIRHQLVGKYRYDIALKTEYAHDEDADNTYFIVTRANSRTQQCGAARRSITRQGVVLSTGEYAIEGPYLRFKERYFTPRRVKQLVFPDSTVKTFSPDRTGQLQLVEIWDYTEGKMERWHWVFSGNMARKERL